MHVMNMECSWGRVLSAWGDLYSRRMEYKGGSIDQAPVVMLNRSNGLHILW